MAKSVRTLAEESVDMMVELERSIVRAAVNYTLAADIAEGFKSDPRDMVKWIERDKQLRELGRRLARLAPSLIERDQPVPPMPGRPRKFFIDRQPPPRDKR